MPLTAKQRAFIDYFVGAAAGNGTEAARMAGYGGASHTLEVTASRLLRNAEIALTIEAIARPRILTRDQVLENLTEVAITQENMNQMARVKALELLARFHQIIDRAQQPTTQVVIINRERPELYARTDTHAPITITATGGDTNTIDSPYTHTHTTETKEQEKE